MQVKKKQKGLPYGVLAVCFVLALGFIATLAAMKPTKARAANLPTVTFSDYVFNGSQLGTSLSSAWDYVVSAKGDCLYWNNGDAYSVMTGKIFHGTFPRDSANPQVGALDIRDKYMNKTLERGTRYYLYMKLNTSSGSASGGELFKLGFIVPKLTLPEEPFREGHTFVGWYLDASLTQPYDGREITEDMEFHAKFAINKYTVTYDAAGGEACDAVIVDWNTALTDTPMPTRTGYNFLGWYVNGERYAGESIKADTTLTARWEIKVFTVTFLVSGEVYKTVQVEYGQSFETAMEQAGMQYFALVDENGARLGKTGTVTEDITVTAAEMTPEEKVGMFLASNWWILAVGGGLIVVLGGACLIMALRKR